MSAGRRTDDLASPPCPSICRSEAIGCCGATSPCAAQGSRCRDSRHSAVTTSPPVCVRSPRSRVSRGGDVAEPGRARERGRQGRRRRAVEAERARQREEIVASYWQRYCGRTTRSASSARSRGGGSPTTARRCASRSRRRWSASARCISRHGACRRSPRRSTPSCAVADRTAARGRPAARCSRRIPNARRARARARRARPAGGGSRRVAGGDRDGLRAALAALDASSSS